MCRKHCKYQAGFTQTCLILKLLVKTCNTKGCPPSVPANGSVLKSQSQTRQICTELRGLIKCWKPEQMRRHTGTLYILCMKHNPEDTRLQDSGRSIWSNQIIWLAASRNNCLWLDKRLKAAFPCNIRSYCLSWEKLETVINHATIADRCLQLDMKLKTDSNYELWLSL